MKRRVEAHFGFIVGLIGQHEACRSDAYFTPREQSYPQADSDFTDIVDGLSGTMIVNQLRVRGAEASNAFLWTPGHDLIRVLSSN